MKSTKDMKKSNTNNQYEMDILRTIIKDVIGVEIVKRTNKREAVDARRIFSKILSDRGYTRSEVAKYLKKDHTSIVHYMSDVDDMIRYVPNFADQYMACKNYFINSVDKTSDEENKFILSLKLRIDELLLDREEMSERIHRHNRLREIIDLLDFEVPKGKEFFILKKIRLMFNEMEDYGEQLE